MSKQFQSLSVLSLSQDIRILCVTACQKREIRFGRIREIEKKNMIHFAGKGDLKSNLGQVFNFLGEHNLCFQSYLQEDNYRDQ